MADRQIDTKVVVSLDEASLQAVVAQIQSQLSAAAQIHASINPGGAHAGAGAGMAPEPGHASVSHAANVAAGGGGGGGHPPGTSGWFDGGSGGSGGGQPPQWDDGGGEDDGDESRLERRFRGQAARIGEYGSQRWRAALIGAAASGLMGSDRFAPAQAAAGVFQGMATTMWEKRRLAAWGRQAGVDEDVIRSTVGPPSRGRTFAAGVGAMAFNLISRPFDDSPEKRALALGEQFSFSNLAGIGGGGEDRADDTYDFQGEMRRGGRAELGGLTAEQFAQMRGAYAEAAGGFSPDGRHRGGASIWEAAHLRMANVDIGASGAYRRQFLAGYGGEGAGEANPAHIVNLAQRAGLGGDDAASILREIAQNTRESAMQGVRSNIPATERYMAAMMATPGLEDVGVRMGAISTGLDRYSRRDVGSLFDGFASAGDAAIMAEAALTAKDPSDPFSIETRREEIAGDKGLAHAARRKHLGDFVAAAAIRDRSSGVPVSSKEAQALASMDPDGGELSTDVTTAHDMAAQDRRPGGGNMFRMAQAYSRRDVTKVGRTQTIRTVEKIEAFGNVMNAASEMFRDVGAWIHGAFGGMASEDY